MPTLQIQLAAAPYRLIAGAHRLSAAAAEAVKGAKLGAVPGLWEITCSAEVALELWDWFDGCQHHTALLAREAWKVHICSQAKTRIKRAMDVH